MIYDQLIYHALLLTMEPGSQTTVPGVRGHCRGENRRGGAGRER